MDNKVEFLGQGYPRFTCSLIAESAGEYDHSPSIIYTPPTPRHVPVRTFQLYKKKKIGHLFPKGETLYYLKAYKCPEMEIGGAAQRFLQRLLETWLVPFASSIRFLLRFVITRSLTKITSNKTVVSLIIIQ